MAQEFSPADLAPDFRSNGTSDPDNPQYEAMVANGFADYQLKVEGLVEKPAAFSLAQLRALPADKIDRHAIASRAGARSRSGRARRCPRWSTS